MDMENSHQDPAPEGATACQECKGTGMVFTPKRTFAETMRATDNYQDCAPCEGTGRLDAGITTPERIREQVLRAGGQAYAEGGGVDEVALAAGRSALNKAVIFLAANGQASAAHDLQVVLNRIQNLVTPTEKD